MVKRVFRTFVTVCHSLNLPKSSYPTKSNSRSDQPKRYHHLPRGAVKLSVKFRGVLFCKKSVDFGHTPTDRMTAKIAKTMKATQSHLVRVWAHFWSVLVNDTRTPIAPISNERAHITLSPVNFVVALLMATVNSIKALRDGSLGCRIFTKYSQGIRCNQIMPPIPASESSIAFSLTPLDFDFEHTAGPAIIHVTRGKSESGTWISRIRRIISRNKILASWPISVLAALYVNYLKLDKSDMTTVMAVPVICSLLIALYFILKTVPLSPDRPKLCVTSLALSSGHAAIWPLSETVIGNLFRWLFVMAQLLEVSIFFGGVSFFAWLALQKLYDKDVKTLKGERLKVFREKLKTHCKEVVSSEQVPAKVEANLQNLFEESYPQVNEPVDLLNGTYTYFLFSAGSFFIAIIIDLVVSQLGSFVTSTSLGFLPSIEVLAFILGLTTMMLGILGVVNLRRMIAQVPEIDPPPFQVTILLALGLALNTLFFWSLGQQYASLTKFGSFLFFSFPVSYAGGLLSFISWEEEDWRRIAGIILVFVPYLVILSAIIMMALRLPIN